MPDKNGKPVIAINLDSEETGSYSTFPYYALRKNYYNIIDSLGAIAIAIPFSPDNVDYYSEIADGLLIPGGLFDIDPAIYGDKDLGKETRFKRDRTDFEFAMIKAFYQKNKPLLGICGGMQLMNVFFDGSLIQDISSEVPNALNHFEIDNREDKVHDIEIFQDSLLAKIIGKNKLKVNSSHHQSPKEVRGGLKISAKSSDGVIEAIEHEDYPFCMGLQWHPEFLVNEEELNIFSEFVKACRSVKK
jgi:putative glutamine amidotransferase